MTRLTKAAMFLLAALTPFARAQNQDDINPTSKYIALAAKLPGYDVVSVRENKARGEDSFLDTTGDGILIRHASFREIIEFAYNISSFDLISEIPGPLGAARFDITAKIAASDGARPAKLKNDQLQAMIIPLLAARFHLRAHVVPKKMTIYEVVVAKGGPKFKLDEPDAPSLDARWGKDNTLVFKKSSMATLAGVLSDSGLHTFIVDRTGLKGAGDFTLKWSPDEAIEQGGRDVISIFTAIQDQLGLKLQAARMPVETLVIDHAEMPSEN